LALRPTGSRDDDVRRGGRLARGCPSGLVQGGIGAQARGREYKWAGEGAGAAFRDRDDLLEAAGSIVQPEGTARNGEAGTVEDGGADGGRAEGSDRLGSGFAGLDVTRIVRGDGIEAIGGAEDTGVGGLS
jgi:hypothetical protein